MPASNPLLWPKPPAIWGYGIAVFSVGAALIVSRWPPLHLQEAPVSLFLCAPTEMSNRIITLQERNLTTIVNDIEHIESQSLNGIAVIKVFFHPGVNISMAIAQIAEQSRAPSVRNRE